MPGKSSRARRDAYDGKRCPIETNRFDLIKGEPVFLLYHEKVKLGDRGRSGRVPVGREWSGGYGPGKTVRPAGLAGYAYS